MGQLYCMSWNELEADEQERINVQYNNNETRNWIVTSFS
jgi:hypothetical protein